MSNNPGLTRYEMRQHFGQRFPLSFVYRKTLSLLCQSAFREEAAHIAAAINREDAQAFLCKVRHELYQDVLNFRNTDKAHRVVDGSVQRIELAEFVRSHLGLTNEQHSVVRRWITEATNVELNRKHFFPDPDTDQAIFY